MILDTLQYILDTQTSQNKLFIRTTLKESLQDFVLQFVYNHKTYKRFIFTGGTCLRKIYGLPRLSEDVDFDSQHEINLAEFGNQILSYFAHQLKYPHIHTKVAHNQQTIFLKFPQILAELGIAQPNDSTQLFVRCDLAWIKGIKFTTQVHSLSTHNFTFFATSYDLPTLFAHKIVVFLTRDFRKGAAQKIAFKGRDLFDLVWFFEQSKKSNFQLVPNWDRVHELTNTHDKQKITELIITKTNSINPKDVRLDLEPFIESPATIDGFTQNFQTIITQNATQINK